MSKESIKEAFQKAVYQMQHGCSNIFCQNTYCRVGKSITQIASDAILLAKYSPGNDLHQSDKFIFCEEPTIHHTSSSLLGLDESGIIALFSDPKSLASNFLIDSSPKTREIDWDLLSNFYEKTEKMTQQGYLKPIWLENCIEQFPRTKYQKIFIPKAILLILVHPFIIDYNNSAIIHITSLLDDCEEGYDKLSREIDILNTDQIEHINGSLQQALSIKIIENTQQIDFIYIRCILDILQCLYDSNERIKRINFREFYNDAANKEINMKKDFKMWYESKMGRRKNLDESNFAFSFYPWVLDANSKSKLLGFEILELMKRELINQFMHDSNREIFVYLEVRRENLLEDTLSKIMGGDLNLKKPLKVHFLGEEGIDEGGVKKEFFQLIVKQTFDPGFSMFKSYQNQRFYWFNPNTLESNVNFELVGMVLGLAIYNSIILDVHLPMVTYKKILGVPTDINDLEEFDPELAKGLKDLLSFEGNVEEVYCRSFYIETEAFGEIIKHPLKENGENIPVTNENREEYVKLYVDWWLNTGVERIFNEFKNGFLKICAGEVINWFKHEELELLICGNPVLDFKELESVTKYEGYTKDSLIVRNI
jgi:hypothetical protein